MHSRPSLQRWRPPGSALASGWVWQPDLYLGFALAAFLSSCAFPVVWAGIPAQWRGVGCSVPVLEGLACREFPGLVSRTARLRESPCLLGVGCARAGVTAALAGARGISCSESRKRGGEIPLRPVTRPASPGAVRPRCRLLRDPGAAGAKGMLPTAPPRCRSSWGHLQPPSPARVGSRGPAAAGVRGDTLPN